jgi:hypothetical protein
MLLAGGFAMGGIAGRDEYYVQPDYDRIDASDYPELNTSERGHRDAPEFISGDEDGSMYEIHSKPYNPEAGFFATTLPAFLNWNNKRQNQSESDSKQETKPEKPIFRAFVEKPENQPDIDLTEKPAEKPADNQADMKNLTKTGGANQNPDFPAADEKANRQDDQANRQAKGEKSQAKATLANPQNQDGSELAKSAVQYSTVQEQANIQANNSEPDIDTDTLQYLDVLYSGNKPDGSLVGRRKIGDVTGLKQSDTDKIHTLLKRRGIIEVRGTSTFPLVDLEAAKAKLKGVK